MRARTDAQVIAVAPVDQVVTRLLPRRGVIGHFVGGHAGLVHAALRQFVEGHRDFDVEFLHRAAQEGGVKRRTFLERQLVERMMRAAL